MESIWNGTLVTYHYTNNGCCVHTDRVPAEPTQATDESTYNLPAFACPDLHVSKPPEFIGCPCLAVATAVATCQRGAQCFDIAYPAWLTGPAGI